MAQAAQVPPTTTLECTVGVNPSGEPFVYHEDTFGIVESRFNTIGELAENCAYEIIGIDSEATVEQQQQQLSKFVISLMRRTYNVNTGEEGPANNYRGLKTFEITNTSINAYMRITINDIGKVNIDLPNVLDAEIDSKALAEDWNGEHLKGQFTALMIENVIAQLTAPGSEYQIQATFETASGFPSRSLNPVVGSLDTVTTAIYNQRDEFDALDLSTNLELYTYAVANSGRQLLTVTIFENSVRTRTSIAYNTYGNDQLVSGLNITTIDGELIGAQVSLKPNEQ